MNYKSLIYSAAMAATLCITAQAQDYTLSQLPSSSPMLHGSRSAGVERLPSDVLGLDLSGEPVQFAAEPTPRIANILVLGGLTTLVILGCTITGLSISMRRKLKQRARPMQFVS